MAGLMSALAAKGRGGDDQIAHVTTGEMYLPPAFLEKYPDLFDAIKKAMADAGADWRRYQVGGDDDSRNPKTGLREFEWGSNEDRGYGESAAENGNFGGPNDHVGNEGESNTGAGFMGSPEIGPAHAQDVNAAFAGDKEAMDRQGYGPHEIGGGEISVLGFSPVENYNPMTGEKVFGLGFNPGKAVGGVLGGLVGGPIGGMIGSWAGSKFTDTSMNFADVTGKGYGISPGATPARSAADASGYDGDYVYDPRTGRTTFVPRS